MQVNVLDIFGLGSGSVSVHPHRAGVVMESSVVTMHRNIEMSTSECEHELTHAFVMWVCIYIYKCL